MVVIKRCWFFTVVLSLYARAVLAHPVPAQTPIAHVVVVVLQDESFDRYFGIYPHAQNNPMEAVFQARLDTPSVAGFSQALLKHNPNLTNPYRMAPGQPTCDLGYGVIAQKRAYNHGLNNMFIWQEDQGPNAINDDGCFPQSVMGYYDGNTLSALWGYAQHNALADHFFATEYATVTGGQIDIIAGVNQGIMPQVLPGVSYQDELLGNNPPLYDDASKGRFKVSLNRTNIGELLSAHQVSWGAFIGGFKPNSYRADGTAVMHKRVLNQAGSLVAAYQSNDDPFQYFKATANIHHVPPKSQANIGKEGPAHHQYDLSQLWWVAKHNQLPAVSFVFANHAHNGHVGSSSPLDEQAFLRQVMAHLTASPQWSSTAVMLEWSSANGWYDHITPPVGAQSMLGNGYGPRLPFLVISQWAKHNYVEHQMLDQSSVLRFIETNWRLGYLGQYTPDRYAHSLRSMFDFRQKQ